jgi:RNA polymerase sigma-70 factor (ECF subfamily)
MSPPPDPEAFYREMHPRLWAYLARTMRPPDAAEDIAQEAFVRLLSSRGAALPADERRAYLFRIAQNLVRDAARRGDAGAPRARCTSEPAAPPPADPIGRRAAAALASLPERDRRLLWLAHAEEWRHADIARALGLAAASVRVLLHRARRRFQDRLTQEDLR